MLSSAEPTRRVQDMLGEIDIPVASYYGAQTARAISNFQISGIPIGHYPVFIRAMAYVKKAAALANVELGDLDSSKGSAIVAACDDIADGILADQFNVDVFQGGAGTSTNMNLNEVIANRALERLGLPKSRFDVIHPNNDVNLSQSTNDVYPTAIRLALLLSYETLVSALDELATAFEMKSAEFADILNSAGRSYRRCADDARPGVQGIRRNAARRYPAPYRDVVSLEGGQSWWHRDWNGDHRRPAIRGLGGREAPRGIRSRFEIGV